MSEPVTFDQAKRRALDEAVAAEVHRAVLAGVTLAQLSDALGLRPDTAYHWWSNGLKWTWERLRARNPAVEQGLTLGSASG